MDTLTLAQTLVYLALLCAQHLYYRTDARAHLRRALARAAGHRGKHTAVAIAYRHHARPARLTHPSQPTGQCPCHPSRSAS